VWLRQTDKKRVTNMAYVNQTSSGLDLRSALGGLATKAVAMVRGLAEAWGRARTFQETYDQLNRLSTRELEDLGLSRSMITRAACEVAYGPKA